MFYMRELTPPLLSTRVDTMDQRLYEFDPKKEDYMLKQFVVWDHVDVDFFTLVTDNGVEFYLPSGYYVFAGSESGDVDWILTDELIDRDIEVFVINKEFNNWSLQNLSLTHVTDQEFYYPDTKNPVPMTDMTGDYTVIVSSIDQYHKLKNMPSNVFFSES